MGQEQAAGAPCPHGRRPYPRKRPRPGGCPAGQRTPGGGRGGPPWAPLPPQQVGPDPGPDAGPGPCPSPGRSRRRDAPQPRPILTPPPLGRSPRELRPPEATGRDEAERDTAANQTLLSPTDSSHWLLTSEGSDGALPYPGTAPPPSANETSSWQRAGASGRGSGREGVAGRGARRPIRITLLQASF